MAIMCGRRVALAIAGLLSTTTKIQRAAATESDPAIFLGVSNPAMYEGAGAAQDNSGTPIPYDVASSVYSAADLGASNNAAGCKAQCEGAYPGNIGVTLIGFSWYDDTLLVDGTASGGLDANNYCICYVKDGAQTTSFGSVTGAYGDVEGAGMYGWSYCYNCVSEQPSSQPSGQPSSMPSENPSISAQPSSQPSQNPSISAQPSSQPSQNPSISAEPSSQPSQNPSISAEPSSQPSENPSISTQPSSQPSSAPSSQPSAIPSALPSSIPSSLPSTIPSNVPSQQPSAIPSAQPSRMPSSEPSREPSSIPSNAPSSQPSSVPSEMPSCTPSSQPTPPEETFLFYPDWSATGEGCKNDGEEPSYMSANPNDYMTSTLDSCCRTFFDWNYNVCMGLLPGICARALFYPDWEGSNTACIDDGNEPSYMTANPVGYLFSHKTDCCERHYSHNYEDCVGTSASAYSNLYYPDWETDHTCKTGGTQPLYMNNAPEIWMFETINDCCKYNFNYKLEECLGIAGAAAGPTPGSTNWYPDWENTDHVCKNDGNEPAYMAMNPSQWMHSTQLSCCETNYDWNFDSCLAYGSAPSPTSAGSAKFYMDWSTSKCVQDCEGGAPCGGIAEFWDVLYNSRATCCAEKGWWNEDCSTD